MKNLYFALVVFFISLNVEAQDYFIGGYYVHGNNDTVQCLIKVEPSSVMANALTVKYKGREFEETLYPDEVSLFCFNNEKYFETLSFADTAGKVQNKYFERVVTGYYSLYLLYEKKTRYFIKKGSGELIELTKFFKNIKTQNNNVYQYVYTLKNLMKDDVQALMQIDRTSLTVSSLTKLIEQYDNRKQQVPFQKFRYKKYTFNEKSFFVGGEYYPFVNNYGLRGGFMVSFTQPEVSDRISYNLGMFYNSPYVSNGANICDDSFISFQISMSYRFSPNKKIPYLFGGVNPLLFTWCDSYSKERIYYFFPYSFIIGAREDFKINNKIQLVGEISLTYSINLMIGIKF